MKISKFNLSTLVLGLSTTIILSCAKPAKPTTPEAADTETDSAVEAIWALHSLTDIEQSCAFMSEGQGLSQFYKEVPGGWNAALNSGSIAITQDLPPATLRWAVAFNKSYCMDGKYRDGSIFWFNGYLKDMDPYVDAADVNINARYLHDYGMASQIALSDYQVDNWRIELLHKDPTDNIPAKLISKMHINYNASTTPMKWRYLGEFKFINLTNTEKTFTVSIDLEKTLTNSTDKKMYDQPVKGANINWTNYWGGSATSTLAPATASLAAKIAYTGTMVGSTSDGKVYKMVINPEKPLIRDFMCYADKVLGTAVVGGSFVPRFSEYHPFTQGVISMTTGCTNAMTTVNTEPVSTVYPRQIFLGNEDDETLPFACDNQAIVLIKGIGYKIDLKKK